MARRRSPLPVSASPDANEESTTRRAEETRDRRGLSTFERRLAMVGALIAIPVAIVGLISDGFGLWDRVAPGDQAVEPSQTSRIAHWNGEPGHFERSHAFVRFLLDHDGQIVHLNARLGTTGPRDLRLAHDGQVDSAVLWERCDGHRPTAPWAVDAEGPPWQCFGTQIVPSRDRRSEHVYYESGLRLVGYFAVSAPGGYRMGRQVVGLKSISTVRAIQAAG